MRHLLIFLIALSTTPVAAAAGDPLYPNELAAAARQQSLAEDPQWLTMLHYQKRALGLGYESLVDSSNFFLSPQGKTEPEAELEATLRAFFSDAVETNESQNPQCQFIGRYHWLKERLGFDPERLPEQRCPRFENWIETINPDQITLIFPSAHLNNPSSMFGHTLIRIDMPNQNERTRLISYAINFAAATDETNGVLFAVRGLTGGYPGQFSIMPYYEKVREYNDLENRDIWEYQLNFSHEEIMRLLRHVWELGASWYQYYFFDENCSYHLLTLFDVARPGLNLADSFPVYAIPSDTVQEVLKVEGLLRRAVYRPSAHTRLEHRLSHMGAEEQKLSLALARGEISADDDRITTLPEQRQALVLEAAQHYVAYQMQDGELPREVAAKRAIGLLRTRATLPALDIEPEPPEPDARPDEGHDSGRLHLGVGSYDDETFYSLRLRPAYHDLLDPQEGYLEGSQINFLDVELRYYPEHRHWQPERLTIIDIASLSPRDRFVKPLSWTVSTGLERAPFTAFDRSPSGFLRGGAGLSYRHGRTLNTYLLAEAAVHAGHTHTGEPLYTFMPQVGLYWTPASPWRTHLRLSGFRYSSGEIRDAAEALLEQRYTISRNIAMRMQLRGRKEAEADDTSHEGSLSLQWYF